MFIVKKIWGTVLTVSLCLGVLSGCGGGNAETVTESSVTLAETSTAEISAEITEAAETTTTTVTKTETTTEKAAAVSETETAEETETELEKCYEFEIIDMSNYAGNFYEWEYDYDIVAKDRESFAGGEDIINTAARTVKDKLIYTAGGKEYTYGEIAALAEKAEKSEEHGGYIFEADGERLMILSDDYESFSDADGRLEPLFVSGVYEDFDGDGKKESFLCFGTFNFAASFTNMRCCVVFVDSAGNAELLPQASGEAFGWGEMLNPMRYNGFIHMCTAFGVNNSTHHAEIYAVENGRTVHKKSMFSPGDPFCGAFMLESAAQAPGSWISFWNEETGEYCTLDEEDITYEEAEALLSSEAFLKAKMADTCKTAEVLQKSTLKVGGKYYTAAPPVNYPLTFKRVNGTFEDSEYEIICPYYSNDVYAVGIDIDKAQAEIIRLEK